MSAVSSLRGGAHPDPGVAGLGPSYAPTRDELAEIARPALPAIEAPAELLCLGLALPELTRVASEAPSSPSLHLLEDVARIASHLGPLERAVHALAPAEAELLRDRLERVRVLADCASALSDLRRQVLAALRTARPA